MTMEWVGLYSAVAVSIAFTGVFAVWAWLGFGGVKFHDDKEVAA